MSYPRILCQKSKLFHFILNLCLLNPFQLHDIPVFYKEKKLLSCIGMTSFFVSYSSLSFQQPTETGRCQKIPDSESLQCRHPPRLEQPHYCKLTSSDLNPPFFFFLPARVKRFLFYVFTSYCTVCQTGVRRDRRGI